MGKRFEDAAKNALAGITYSCLYGWYYINGKWKLRKCQFILAWNNCLPFQIASNILSIRQYISLKLFLKLHFKNCVIAVRL